MSNLLSFVFTHTYIPTFNFAFSFIGIYYPLAKMTKKEEDDLQNAGFLFQKPTPNNVLANCGAARGKNTVSSVERVNRVSSIERVSRIGYLE